MYAYGGWMDVFVVCFLMLPIRSVVVCALVLVSKRPKERGAILSPRPPNAVKYSSGTRSKSQL